MFFFFIPNTRYKSGILVRNADIFASYAVFRMKRSLYSKK